MSVPRFTIVKVGRGDEGDTENNDSEKPSVSFVLSPDEAPTHVRNGTADDSDAAPFLGTDRKFASDAAYYQTCGEAKPHADHYRVHSEELFCAQRPTLEQLHEAASCGVEIAPQTDLLIRENEANLLNRKLPIGDRPSKRLFREKPNGANEEGDSDGDDEDNDTDPTRPPSAKSSAVKLGWIRGVLMRCMLTIWGVSLFLRLTWIVGEAGSGYTATIIGLSTIVTVITTTSLSAICTNGEVGNGGIYFLTSRSLGAEFGGLVGVIFSVANIIAVAMHTVGFSETLVVILYRNCWTLTGDITNDIRLIGVITMVVLLGIAIVGVRYESLAQSGLLVLLIGALGVFLIGSVIPPDETERAHGFVGYNMTVFMENLKPSFSPGESFFTVFAVFFPAATGILSGANISGDLKDPNKAIPRGTMLAICITSVTYLMVAVIASACVLREYVHDPTLAVLLGLGINGLNSSGVANSTASSLFGSTATTSPVVTSLVSNNSGSVTIPCGEAKTGRYGLRYDMQVVGMISVWEPLIFAGIFAAALSSALAALVSAPKMLQRICSDRLFPIRGLESIGRGFGRDSEPRILYVISAVMATCFVAIGSLNVISGIVSNFYMCTYIFINFSCFSASVTHTPGWRPKFRWYNKYLSLFGSVLCLGCMFIMNWWAALMTIAVSVGLFLYLYFRKPEHANWGSSLDANAYRRALQSTYELVWVAEHVKNFRPQILVLSGAPFRRPLLVDLAASLTKNVGLMVVANVSTEQRTDYKAWKLAVCEGYTYLRHRKIKAFYNYVQASDLGSAVNNMMQTTGLGKIKPNIVLLGYKSDWRSYASRLQAGADGRNANEVEKYVNIIHDAFDLHYGVAVFRVSSKLASSDVFEGMTLLDFMSLDLRIRQGASGSFGYAQETRPRRMSDSQSGAAGPNTSANSKVLDQNQPAASLPSEADVSAKLGPLLTHADSAMSITAHSRVIARSVRKSVSGSMSSMTLSTDVNETDIDAKKSRSKLLRIPRVRGAHIELKSPDMSASRMTINEDILQIRAVSTTDNDSGVDAEMVRLRGAGAVDDSPRRAGRGAARNLAARRRAESETDACCGPCGGLGQPWLESFDRHDANCELMNAFHRKQSGRIDVWWLYDDGGLTLLLPHILSTRANWKDCQLRVLTQPMHAAAPNDVAFGAAADVGNDAAPKARTDMADSLRSVLLLLSKFRINCRDVEILSSFGMPPREQTVREFEESIAEWRLAEGESKADWPAKISDEDLTFWKRKTEGYLRVRELLLEHSYNATMIILTMPIPRKGVNAALYLAWLDALTRDLPNTLLLRGNQQSVLTYYT